MTASEERLQTPRCLRFHAGLTTLLVATEIAALLVRWAVTKSISWPQVEGKVARSLPETVRKPYILCFGKYPPFVNLLTECFHDSFVATPLSSYLESASNLPGVQ